ncbi:hypothetical protein BSKO_09878 [Bryopsis sp. KO-2023]|nr:hypothetical protein BSKO_09878 [Bryopsis sp. KO-2023]
MKRLKLDDGEVGPVLRVKALLKMRRDDGKINGFKPGRTLCVDNLGWGFNQVDMEEQFRSKLVGVKDVRFAATAVPSAGGVFYGGWGCLEFETYELAVEGLSTLDSMYIKLPGSSVPRPLIAHFPFWTEMRSDVDDGQAVDFGCFDIFSPKGTQYKPVSAHFAQLNNMGALGLDWAEKDEARQSLKDRVRRQYIATLANAIRETLPSNGVLNAVNGGPEIVGRDRTFWLRGVASSVSADEIRDWFSQFDVVEKVQRLVDPVSLKPNGHAIVTIQREEQARLLKHQFETSLVLIGGVRPIRLKLLERNGGPTGFEGLFDEAMAAACGVSVESLPRDGGVVTTSCKLTQSERTCGEECRKILEKCASLRGMLFRQAVEILKDLHAVQLKNLSAECEKLEFLTSSLSGCEQSKSQRDREKPRRCNDRRRRRRS